MSCELNLHLYTSCEYDYIMLILSENIYIIIDNVSVSKKGSYLEDILDMLR